MQAASILHTAKKRVLIVEDLEVERYLISRMIGSTYELDFAATPRQAMLKLVDQLYDVILVDLNLADSVTGVELTEFLRSRTRNNTRPVIAMTAHDQVFFKDRALSAGCNDYLEKPLSAEGLIEAIDRHAPRW